MTHRKRYPATFKKACNVLYAVFVLRWTQTQAAITFQLNSGTVSHICRRKRFKNAIPTPF